MVVRDLRLAGARLPPTIRHLPASVSRQRRSPERSVTIALQAGDWSHHLAMIVCSCNVLSDKEVRAVAQTVTHCTTSAVYACLGCRARCGRCARTIREIMDEVLDQAKVGRPASCIVQLASVEQAGRCRQVTVSVPPLHCAVRMSRHGEVKDSTAR